MIDAFSRPGDLVAAPDGSPAVIEAAATAGRRPLNRVSAGDPRTARAACPGETALPPSAGPDVLLAPDSPHRGTAVLAVAGCHGPGCCDAPGPGSPGGPALLYAACHRVLAPGGVLAAVIASPAPAGSLADLAGPVAAARAAGLVYVQHIVLVHASIAGRRLVPGRADADAAGDPGGIRVHSDLLIFTKPGKPASSAELKDSQPEPAGGFA
jgi:hypothetical protein